MNAPVNLVVGWWGSDAEIPAGWSRVSALNQRYVCGVGYPGVPNPELVPTSHTHEFSNATHTHSVTQGHSHSFSGTLDSVDPGEELYVGASVAYTKRFTHSHSVSGTGATPIWWSVLAAILTCSSTDNDEHMNYVTMIFIKSDGSSPIPVGAVVFSQTVLTGWSQLNDAKGMFLKGAPAGYASGSPHYGTQHRHSFGNHDHAVTHSHPVNTYSSQAQTALLANLKDNATPGEGNFKSGKHKHVVPFLENVELLSGGLDLDTDYAVGLHPQNISLYIVKKDEESIEIPIGAIAVWMNGEYSIPAGWVVCDGLNGTPDTRYRFVLGANTPADVGVVQLDATYHGHLVQPHNHSYPSSHDHVVRCDYVPTYQPYGATRVGGGVSALGGHNHNITASMNTSAGIVVSNVTITGSSVGRSLPRFSAVIFIMYVGQAAEGSVVSHLDTDTGLCEVVLTRDAYGPLYRRGVLGSSPRVSDLSFESQIRSSGTAYGMSVPHSGKRIVHLWDGASVREYASYDLGDTWAEE